MQRWLMAGAIGWCVVTGAVAQERFSERLAPRDFAAAGLDKLTAEERATLDALIAGERRAVAPATASGDAPVIPESARIGRKATEHRAEAFTSRLVGTFKGWTGSTIFRLENGQRWQQVDGGTYLASPPRENPEVTLSPSRFSGYFMKVDGIGTRVRVKLLED